MSEFNPILAHPAPDFAEFQRVILGQQKPQRVHLVELLFDQEVMQAITERYLGETWVPVTANTTTGGLRSGAWVADTPPEAHYAQVVNVYYRLGYDCVTFFPIWENHPSPHRRRTKDTADLSRGQREWTENEGIIGSRAEAEQFPWDKIRFNRGAFELAARHLPAGMKLMAGGSLFEHVMKNMVGHERLLYLIVDEPDLAADLFARWGQIVYDYYAEILTLDAVGGIFHGDYFGTKTSLVVSPRFLRQHILPWLKKYAALAHAHGKLFFLHSCGYLFKTIIDDLIDDVQIDGLHSYQEVVLPVTEFQTRFGQRVATLGGVDIDHLARMNEPALRAYVRQILDHCMPSGRYALGTGNSLVNYIPLENYFALLDEARQWRMQ